MKKLTKAEAYDVLLEECKKGQLICPPGTIDCPDIDSKCIDCWTAWDNRKVKKERK